MNIAKRVAVIALSLAIVSAAPGQVLAATADESAKHDKTAAEKTADKAPAAPEPKVVTVQAGDYLEKIAKANESTSLRLFYANTFIANPDLIYPGQQLRIPAADETLTPREVPQNQAVPVPTPKASAQATAPSRPTPARAAVTHAAPVANGSTWDRLAACESGGNWGINTGNGYYGGLQFSASSWRSVGGSGLPSDASRDEQIMRAKMLQARSGWGAWPACSAKLGLR